MPEDILLEGLKKNLKKANENLLALLLLINEQKLSS